MREEKKTLCQIFLYRVKAICVRKSHSVSAILFIVPFTIRPLSIYAKTVPKVIMIAFVTLLLFLQQENSANLPEMFQCT